MCPRSETAAATTAPMECKRRATTASSSLGQKKELTARCKHPGSADVIMDSKLLAGTLWPFAVSQVSAERSIIFVCFMPILFYMSYLCDHKERAPFPHLSVAATVTPFELHYMTDSFEFVTESVGPEGPDTGFRLIFTQDDDCWCGLDHKRTTSMWNRSWYQT